MQFKDVIGQAAAKQKLTAMVHSGKIPHALMFSGPEGNGSLALALALSKFIQCESRGKNDSCGTCPACLKNEKFIHPDVHFTFPVVPRKSGEAPISADYTTDWRSAISANAYLGINDWLQSIGAENRQGNITVRECHEIIRRLSMKTYESGYKIQIIWLAEFLKEAGNTLLKVIEEPPDNTVFILITENSEAVLTTILSRVQLIKINAIDDDDVKDELVKRFTLDESAAKRIARISDGNFNTALAFAEGEENPNDKLLHRWLVCCFNLKQKNSANNVSQLIEWVDEISKIGRENQKMFLKYALFFLRECGQIMFSGNSGKLEDEELQIAKRLSAKLGVEQLEALSQLINLMHYHIERNANPKILFFSNSFKAASVFAGEEVAVD